MTILNELVERVSNGETFHIDFEKRTMKVGNKFIIKNGEYDTSRRLFSVEDDSHSTIDVILQTIDCLYERYKYSIPSKRSDSKRKVYFKALPMEEIPDEKMVMQRREILQAKLEGYILCMILRGDFIWHEDEMGKWFWQSSEDKDLVILRKWIENN